ncbi:hypothetical protein OHC95_07980 [Escherichia coli]|uniref:hypothetical protein n=1 Tax=Escherichia coli TaxID=562 RepID=UPI002237B67F|nr:hypothetical protein [Escherichia coli]MCW7272314.1 hypothetical protein [Escherichia coli]
MKQKGLIKFKKIVKKNFWVDDIKKYAVNIPKNCDLIVVFDSDVIDRVDRFIQNVNYLASRKHSIFIATDQKFRRGNRVLLLCNFK